MLVKALSSRHRLVISTNNVLIVIIALALSPEH